MQVLGLYENWMTEAKILKSVARNFPIHEQRWRDQREELRSYGGGGNPYRDVVNKSCPAAPPFAFKVSQSLHAAGREHALAMRALFNHEPKATWTPLLAIYCSYQYWSLRIQHEWELRYPTNGLSFTLALASLADILSLGWSGESEAMTREILVLYQGCRFFGVSGEFGQPLYHWLLRICLDYYGLHFDGWGRGIHGEDQECLREPILNELFAHWRDEDLSPLHDHLIWLCDYYTHRTRDADGTEFGNDLLHARFPATILAWFRLREQLGLSIPQIDHPLMQPDYARLIPVQAFYTDNLLERVLERLRREEIPDLGGMPGEQSLGSPTPNQKKGVSSRWFGRK